MPDKEKNFQIRLWVSAVLGSIITFFVIKLVWAEASYMLLLLLLVVGFLINLVISIISSKRKKGDITF
ncbi:hypothetical protein ACNRWW_03150 [Metabacillus sp. HB246100]